MKPMKISEVRRRRESGHVIVEMGLCMTVLFLMIFGITEYSRIAYANNFTAFAAQQAARYASIRGAASATPLSTNPSPCGTTCVNATSGDATATFVQGLSVALNTANLTVTTTWSCATGASCANANTAGNTVSVKVNYGYNPFFTLVAPLPSTFNMNSTATMTVVQ
jgi:Flp pilus assembly protein TadG